MSILNQPPPDQLCDAAGRPCFSWNSDLSQAQWRALLHSDGPEVRAMMRGRLLRQARVDYVFLSLADIRVDWQRLERHLGRSRAWWSRLLAALPESRSGGSRQATGESRYADADAA